MCDLQNPGGSDKYRLVTTNYITHMLSLPHWPIPYGHQPPTHSLERIRELLSRLGNPHLNLPPVVHVAGTNGKGSTIAFLQAIFEAAGYSVHKYTSPHLMHFRERICLSGVQIDDGLLAEYIEEARLAAGDMQLTFFEGTTAAAFLAFSRHKADVLLLEVGMGGRLDPTNVIEKPAMSVITPIAYDHMEFLGNTLEAITGEKAGIIKPGVPCIISWQYQEALAVLRNKCEEVGAPYFACREHWQFTANSEGGFQFDDGDECFDLPPPSLQGPHQIMNAATAVAAIMCLEGFTFRFGDITKGLQSAHWPARLQRIKRGKVAASLPDGWELWLDGAHNAAGAQMLALMIEQQWQDKPIFLINGRTADRDIAGFLRPFAGRVQKVFAVPIYLEPKSEDPHKIAQAARELGFETAVCGSVLEAVTACVGTAVHSARILVAGSLYLAADLSEGM